MPPTPDKQKGDTAFDDQLRQMLGASMQKPPIDLDASFSNAIVDQVLENRRKRGQKRKTMVRYLVVGVGIGIAMLLPFAVEPMRLGLQGVFGR
jgi:hypothetical protein